MAFRGIARHSKKTDESLDAQRKSLENHLSSSKWDKQEEAMVKAHEYRIGSMVEKLTPIWMDPGDLAKKYAEKMEYLGRVRDADESSHRGETVTEPGYWLWQSFTEVYRQKDPVPLVNFAFSLHDPKFKSFNVAWQFGLKKVAQATNHNGVAVIDRGGDSDIIFQEIQANKLGFMIRLVGSRYVEDVQTGQIGSVHAIARTVGQHGYVVLKEKTNQRKKRWHCSYGYKRVKVPALEGEFTLIVTVDAMQPNEEERYRYFLTNVPIKDEATVKRLLEMYALRWKAEEAARFLKTALGQETVRTLSFRCIRRLITFVYWVMALIAFTMNDLSNTTLDQFREIGLTLKRDIEFLFYSVARAIAVLIRDIVPLDLIILCE